MPCPTQTTPRVTVKECVHQLRLQQLVAEKLKQRQQLVAVQVVHRTSSKQRPHQSDAVRDATPYRRLVQYVAPQHLWPGGHVKQAVPHVKEGPLVALVYDGAEQHHKERVALDKGAAGWG